MYYYFYASDHFVIKLNGLYLGSINNTIKFCNVESHNAFVELCPIGKISPSVNFVLDEKFLTSPPDNVILTDLKGGYLIKVKRCFTKKEFNVIAQRKFNDAVATIFALDGFYLSVETINGVFNFPIDFFVSSAVIDKFEGAPSNVIKIELYGDKNLLIFFDVATNTIIFNMQFDSLELNKDIRITERFNDIKKHTVVTRWAYRENKFELTDKTIECKKNTSIYQLNNRIIPYAFLEDLYLGQSIDEYLAKNILDNKDKLTGFFGSFLGVMPPPFFRDDRQVGLIYKQNDNKYFAEYFTFEITDKKIFNIKKLDS